MALRNGTRFSVGMADVFPDGCALVPGSITEAQDYDEKTRVRTPAIDKITGKRVFQCRVADMDPELEGRSRETVVKILTDRPRPRRPGPLSSWSSSKAFRSPRTWTPEGAKARAGATRGWRSPCGRPASSAR